MEQETLIHKDIVYLKHNETNGYLTDTGISYQNGYILGTKKEQDQNSVWILEKYSPPVQGLRKPNYNRVEIWPCDMIVIRNGKTGNVITCNIGNKSPVTKQGEMIVANQYEGTGEQQFLLIFDKFDEINLNRAKFVNVLDENHALHSHNRQYKNPKDVNEVTGFTGVDQNDYWTIIPASRTVRQSIFINEQQDVEKAIRPRCYKYIHNLDKVVIRNCFTGGSLHSHTSTYTHGNKQQEITWRYSIRRDQNDWWIIELANGNSDITSQIPNKSLLFLQHNGTGKKLMHINGARNKKKDYLEVNCGIQDEAEFQIEGVDMGIPELNSLILEYPFRLKHIKTSQYLAALSRPSSKTTFQGEVVLVGGKEQNTIWMIETVDSLFD
ncbi:unnamed protein product [Paramecium primaurelia]|uniref:MIR domain-containing protein n=1 Tax=Paramecium primaurelia TaxID=5886 RepID=A0A8S1MUJ0_PARPR|nr:unnamed protein product [Paramecium primaurelia]